MKRNILFTAFLFIVLSAGYSQDKIITLNKDTIECKINKVSKSAIFFDVFNSGVRTSGRVSIDSLLNYSISVNPSEKEKMPINQFPFERLRLGINAGPGFLLASSEEAEDSMESLGLEPGQAQAYYSDLKSGFNADAGITFLITPDYGAGVKYKFFKTNARTEGFFDPGDGVNLIYSTFEEQIYINYIGAMFSYCYPMGDKNIFKLNLNFSAGLATYRNEAGYMGSYLLLTGKDFGMDACVGFEYFFKPKLSVVADLSAFYATFSKLKVSDGSSSSTLELEKDSYEDLSRLDISLGIRFYIFKR
jgi:hypothetical protein